MSSHHRSIVVCARDADTGSSKDGAVPWLCPSYLSIWHRFLSCPGATIVAGKTMHRHLDKPSIHLLDDPSKFTGQRVVVVGGEATIKRWMIEQEPDLLVLCTVEGQYGCTETLTNFDLCLPKYRLWARKDFYGCRWEAFVRHPGSPGTEAPWIPVFVQAWHLEAPYLSLCQKILQSPGLARTDRTGTGTLSIFGEHLVFDVAHCFPLLTTKRVFWKGVVKELLWFLGGKTDATILSEDGVKIWDDNTTKEALRKRGLRSYQPGDAGPIYGHQWRHWGAQYRGCGDYSGQGNDQLKALIRSIKTDPYSRRHIVSAWNVDDLDKMSLPPCHILFQCYVTTNGKIDLHLYQRSVDIGLGLPFNIASYALLLYMICDLTKYRPGRLIISTGDTHIYNDHVDAIREQISRLPLSPPTITIKINKQRTWLHEFVESDIRLHHYHSHPIIPMKMST